MKLNHISRDKLSLLVFFCGFYTDENCFIEFDSGNYDILFIYDYSNLNFDTLAEFDFSPYTEINLIAYSFGVFAANISKNNLPVFQKTCAVSGTIYPIDENFGIKPKIYDLMLNSFDENVLLNFINKMELNSNGKIAKAKRSIENLHSELINIKNYAESNKITPLLKFDKAVITKKDRIFPYLQQKNFWQGKTFVSEIDSGHFPFFNFKNFDEILEM
ncbi:MAG: DUF452 family protein [Candidatus Gastranaerophilales bacterium]|nr:DUF452 family protein [Candidatus Gastranaerophilales bacterium]